MPRAQHKGRSGEHLTESETATLEALCQALLPSLLPARGDSPELFAADARGRGVAPRVAETLRTLREDEKSRFRLFLRMLDQPWFIALQIGRASRFRSLGQADAEAVLVSLSSSRLADLRAGYQAIRRLATFVFYSVQCSAPHDPVWDAIGYVPSNNPAAMPSPLKLTPITAHTTVECDVCIIGSGAGGSVAAAQLAGSGRKVIVLEAGSDWQSEDFDQREEPGTRELYQDGGATSTRDLSITLLAGAALGGGTAINWQTSLRTPENVRDEWAESSGCPHFAGDSFTKSLDAVCERLSVGTAESDINPNNAVLRAGCQALDYEWRVTPRNSSGCDAAQCGNCVYGCRHGGKQSGAVTWLRDAQANGDTEIIARCRAERITIANGRVTGVVATAIERNGGRHTVQIHAKVVVAACGALHTPALMLRSGIIRREVGRNLFIHPTTGIGATFARRIEAWKGPPQTIMCSEFDGLADGYGFRIETAPAHPGLLAHATPWVSARAHRENMQAAASKAFLIALVRDTTSGRVTTDRSGRPVVDYIAGKGEQAMLRTGMSSMARIAQAAGATMVQTLHTAPLVWSAPAEGGTDSGMNAFCDAIAHERAADNHLALFSAHQMGTCRMGRDPALAVCDAEGQVFGIRGLYIADASAFPGSSGVNPMITIMALAHHSARAMREA